MILSQNNKALEKTSLDFRSRYARPSESATKVGERMEPGYLPNPMERVGELLADQARVLDNLPILPGLKVELDGHALPAGHRIASLTGALNTWPGVLELKNIDPSMSFQSLESIDPETYEKLVKMLRAARVLHAKIIDAQMTLEPLVVIHD